jgi:hypothetical protein
LLWCLDVERWVGVLPTRAVFVGIALPVSLALLQPAFPICRERDACARLDARRCKLLSSGSDHTRGFLFGVEDPEHRACPIGQPHAGKIAFAVTPTAALDGSVPQSRFAHDARPCRSLSLFVGGCKTLHGAHQTFREVEQRQKYGGLNDYGSATRG